MIGELTVYDDGSVVAYVRPTGLRSLTVTTSENVPVPPLLDTVTVHAWPPDVTAVGVPLTMPVVVSRDSPVGRAGTTENNVAAPPLRVGELLVITPPFLYTAGTVEYVSITGAKSVTVRRSGNVSEPPLFVTLTVYVAH